MITDCFELVTSWRKWELVPIKSLPKPKLGFAACVATNGLGIFIAGGFEGQSKKPTTECYYYDIT